MNQSKALSSLLSPFLKEPGKYVFFNAFSTKPCVPVVHKPKHAKPWLTTKTTHLCILFSPEKIPLCAVEIFTYCTFNQDSIERLVYVSKADTTGLAGSANVNVGGFVSEYLKWVCQIPIKELLKGVKLKRSNQEKSNERHSANGEKNTKRSVTFASETAHGLYVLQKRAAGDVNYGMPQSFLKSDVIESLKLKHMGYGASNSVNIKTKLVLFTRSEGQYLFPESMKNSGKHVLDGRALLKWWLKNINLIATGWSDCDKYLNILNSEAREIMRYFPSANWKIGNVYADSEDLDSPAIYKIPLLPDDPKGRFLEHLVVEGRAKKVKAKQYWQELAIRQEFSFGAVVGLIGISGFPLIHQAINTEYVSNSLSPKCMRQFRDIITTKDYSDSSDWNTVYNELQKLPTLTPYEVIGCWKGRQGTKRKVETDNLPVNTLMCVRSKKNLKR